MKTGKLLVIAFTFIGMSFFEIQSFCWALEQIPNEKKVWIPPGYQGPKPAVRSNDPDKKQPANKIQQTKPTSGPAKFYHKDDILAISQGVLAMALERGRLSVEGDALKSAIKTVEEKKGISGISGDPRQVSMVENILVTTLNKAFKQGFQKFEERLNKTVELLRQVEDLSYLKINEEQALILYVNSGPENGPLGDHDVGATDHGLVYIPSVSAEANKIYQGLQNKPYKLFNTEELKLFQSANPFFMNPVQQKIMKRIEQIAAEGIGKDVWVGITEDKLFSSLKKDIAHHESWHLAQTIIKILDPSDSQGNSLGNEVYAYLYQMAIGALPHWVVVSTFKQFLDQKIYPRDPLNARRTQFTLNALARVANLSVHFDTDDLSQLEKGLAALMKLSKPQLQNAALAVMNELRGNANRTDRQILNLIKLQ